MNKKAGRDFTTIIKLGVEDAFPGGTTAEEGIQAAGIIAGQGNADIIEVNQGLQDLADLNKTSMKPRITALEKQAYYRGWTKQVKAAVKGCARVTLQGGLRTPALMEEILENGEADFVSMCRPYIREPGIVNRWLGGNMAKATCISCNQCVLGHVMHNKPLVCVLDRKAS